MIVSGHLCRGNISYIYLKVLTQYTDNGYAPERND